MYVAIQAHAQSLTHTVPHTQGKYGYQYIEEGEGEFVSRVGQRNMIKDIVKQEIVLAEGEQRECLVETEIHYCLTAGLFPVGCYVYPFLYQLPHNLPGKKNQYFFTSIFFHLCVLQGSFRVQCEDMDSGKSWEGVVQYSVSAVLTGPTNNNKISVSV